MVPFSTRVGERALREMRVLNVLKAGDGLPQGEFAFFEFYCDEPDCDCRRVILQVVSGPPHHQVMATVNYGWESSEFYGTWGVSSDEVSGATLEPFGDQTEYAQAFLNYFVDVMLADEAYRQRLIRHYHEFKDTLPTRAAARPAPEGGNSRARRAARRRAERESRKWAA